MMWLTRVREKPFLHQIVGVEHVVSHPYAMLADEMGAGKTKQAIDAALVLFLMGLIHRVIVVAPAAVRGVWFHPELGELAKHLWNGVPNYVIEYHAKQREWFWNKQPGTKPLTWIVTNYDYIRRAPYLQELLTVADQHTLLILDESSAVKNYKAAQTKACMKLRAKSGRVLLLNGTPIADNPQDLYSQGLMMHKSILECEGITHFRSRYAVMNRFIKVKTKWGVVTPVVEKWTNLDDIQRRFAPYVLRRLKKDCLDLPEKLPPVTIPVPLTDATWAMYQKMKTDLVTWLETQPAGMSMAVNAITQTMRLAQITSGLLGGVQTIENLETETPLWLGDVQPEVLTPDREVRIIGSEKLDLFVSWLKDRLEEDPNFKVLVWCRFREEVNRVYNAVYPDIVSEAGKIYGTQKATEREYALRILDPRKARQTSTVVVGTPATGAMGLNLTAANCVVYISNDYSLKTRLQSEDRVHRPGQTRAVSYFDFMATGPQGQKTIDALILEALREKKNLADFTASAWIKAITEGDKPVG